MESEIINFKKYYTDSEYSIYPIVTIANYIHRNKTNVDLIEDHVARKILNIQFNDINIITHLNKKYIYLNLFMDLLKKSINNYNVIDIHIAIGWTIKETIKITNDIFIKNIYSDIIEYDPKTKMNYIITNFFNINDPDFDNLIDFETNIQLFKQTVNLFVPQLDIIIEYNDENINYNMLRDFGYIVLIFNGNIAEFINKINHEVTIRKLIFFTSELDLLTDSINDDKLPITKSFTPLEYYNLIEKRKNELKINYIVEILKEQNILNIIDEKLLKEMIYYADNERSKEFIINLEQLSHWIDKDSDNLNELFEDVKQKMKLFPDDISIEKNNILLTPDGLKKYLMRSDDLMSITICNYFIELEKICYNYIDSLRKFDKINKNKLRQSIVGLYEEGINVGFEHCHEIIHKQSNQIEALEIKLKYKNFLPIPEIEISEIIEENKSLIKEIPTLIYKSGSVTKISEIYNEYKKCCILNDIEFNDKNFKKILQSIKEFIHISHIDDNLTQNIIMNVDIINIEKLFEEKKQPTTCHIDLSKIISQTEITHDDTDYDELLIDQSKLLQSDQDDFGFDEYEKLPEDY